MMKTTRPPKYFIYQLITDTKILELRIPLTPNQSTEFAAFLHQSISGYINDYGPFSHIRVKEEYR